MIFVLIVLVGAGQYKLSIEFWLVFFVHLSEHNLHIALLVKNTLLGDVLWGCTLQGCTNFKTSKNLSDFILWISRTATNISDNIFKSLLSCACNPYFRLANLIKTLH